MVIMCFLLVACGRNDESLSELVKLGNEKAQRVISDKGFLKELSDFLKRNPSKKILSHYFDEIEEELRNEDSERFELTRKASQLQIVMAGLDKNGFIGITTLKIVNSQFSTSFYMVQVGAISDDFFTENCDEKKKIRACKYSELNDWLLYYVVAKN
ncbi:hypothetical protein GCM10009092_12660 [Bowmanella denitrificans]|uniref:Lipoprotein n=1 Tax=Bowmanella denitrificans TaxID=366582 RepID=A0ABP3GM99_9ALTE